MHPAAERFAPSKRQGTLSATTVANKPVCLTQAGVNRFSDYYKAGLHMIFRFFVTGQEEEALPSLLLAPPASVAQQKTLSESRTG